MPPQSWWHNPPGYDLTKCNLQFFPIPALLTSNILRNTLIPYLLDLLQDALDFLFLLIKESPPGEFLFPEKKESNEFSLTVNGDAGNLVGKVSRDFGGVDKRGGGVDDRYLLEGAKNLGRLRRGFYLAKSVSFCK